MCMDSFTTQPRNSHTDFAAPTCKLVLRLLISAKRHFSNSEERMQKEDSQCVIEKCIHVKHSAIHGVEKFSLGRNKP